jgi:hypothetical protein
MASMQVVIESGRVPFTAALSGRFLEAQEPADPNAGRLPRGPTPSDGRTRPLRRQVAETDTRMEETVSGLTAGRKEQLAVWE